MPVDVTEQDIHRRIEIGHSILNEIDAHLSSESPEIIVEELLESREKTLADLAQLALLRSNAYIQ